MNKQMVKFQEKIKKRFPEEDLIVLEYTKAKEPCSIKCNKCGKIYNFKVAENSYRKNKKCLCSCAKEFKPSKTYLQFLDKIKNGNYTIIQEPINKKSDDKIILCCNNCGYVRKTDVYTFVHSSTKCPKCEIKNVHLTKDEVRKEILNITNGKIELIGDYINNVTSTLFKCKECGFTWRTKPGNIKTGTRCPKCSRKESRGEVCVRKWLEKHNINFIQEYPISSTGARNQKIDFYIPHLRIGIEYNGIQHYEPIEHFGGQEGFEKTIKRDYNKKEYCRKNNIKLITIKYTDYKNINKILTSTFNDYYVASSEAKK